MEVFIEHFDEVVYGFEIHQVVVVDVDANAKVEASIAAIDDLEVAKLFC